MKTILTIIVISLAFIVQPVQADIDKDCKNILDGAQKVYSDLFPSNPETQNLGPWCYRFYKQTKMYIGIFRGGEGFKTAGVYGLGGIFGDDPVYIAQTDVVIDLLDSQMSGGSEQGLCDTSELPKGLVYETDGNVTKVSTGGECIKLPQSTNFCDTLPEIDQDGAVVATGKHVLTETTITDFNLNGIEMPSIPGLPNVGGSFDYLKDEVANQAVCVIHAPEGMIDHTIKTDICLDMSDTLGGLVATVGKVTMEYKGVTKATKVKDCFDTDARVISNLLTEETWVNNNGEFVKLDK